jgi:ribosome-associated translation inhibitor RaiA
MIAFVEGEVNRFMKRFARRLTRVEVHLSDVNSHKFGTHDKRCRVEVRPAGHRPLTASNSAGKVQQAVVGALTKMRNSLETVFGRIQARRAAVPAKPSRAVKEPAQSKATLKVAAAGAMSAAQPEEIELPAESARSPKKKPIYQARRKSWPRR